MIKLQKSNHNYNNSLFVKYKPTKLFIYELLYNIFFITFIQNLLLKQVWHSSQKKELEKVLRSQEALVRLSSRDSCTGDFLF